MATSNSISLIFQDGVPTPWLFDTTLALSNVGVILPEFGDSRYQRLGYISLIQRNTFPAGTYVTFLPVGSVWRNRTYFRLPVTVNAIGINIAPARGIPFITPIFFIWNTV